MNWISWDEIFTGCAPCWVTARCAWHPSELTISRFPPLSPRPWSPVVTRTPVLLGVRSAQALSPDTDAVTRNQEPRAQSGRGHQQKVRADTGHPSSQCDHLTFSHLTEDTNIWITRSPQNQITQDRSTFKREILSIGNISKVSLKSEPWAVKWQNYYPWLGRLQGQMGNGAFGKLWQFCVNCQKHFTFIKTLFWPGANDNQVLVRTLETLAAQSSWRQNNHFPEVGSCFVMTILNDTQTQSQVWSAPPPACSRDQGIIVGFWIDMKFSRNQSQKPECLRAVPDRCSAYQSLNHREIVILHRNYIQKQNRAKSLPTTYLHNKVSFLLKSYFLSYEPHKNIHKTILITLFWAHSSSRIAICSQKNSFASCCY